MEKSHEANYKSQKLNSQLFRRLKNLIDKINNVIMKENNEPKLDELMYVNNDLPSEEYLEKAAINYKIYSASLKVGFFFNNITFLLSIFNIFYN